MLPTSGWATSPGHGHGEPVEHPASQAVVWALRLGLFLAGGIAGWVLSPVVNRVMVGFFAGFNRVV